MTVRRAVRGALVALIAANLFSCGGDDTTSPPPEEPAFPADYLQTYTEVRNLRTSNNHDGSNINTAAITVHCSPNAANAYVNGVYPLPEGCVLVKTQYGDPSGTFVTGYAVMVKGAPGSAPGLGDWHWQEVDVNRNVVQAVDMQNCFDCHSSNSDCSEDFTCTLP